MWWRWRRIDEIGRRSLWRLYGWFTGLMCIGSCAGAVAWAVFVKQSALFIVSQNANAFASNHDTPATISTLIAEQADLTAAHQVIYTLEFFCVTLVKLMMLDRMIALAVYKATLPLQQRGVIAGRIATGLVLALNTVGLCGDIAAAAYLTQSSAMRRDAAAAWAAYSTITEEFESCNRLADMKYELALQAASVQNFAEVLALLLIILFFVAVGVVCARRIAASLHLIDGANTVLRKGSKLRLQIIGSVSVVFVTFLLRAVFSIMNAVANLLQNNSQPCRSICVGPCRNTFGIMQSWMLLTPEFQLLVVLISSPLALLVALWGMTSDSTLHVMASRHDEATLTARIASPRQPEVNTSHL